MGVYIELQIPVTDNSLKEILIACLTDIGTEGFEEERHMLKAFMPSENFNQSEFEKIIQQNNLSYTKLTIEDRNWNAEWESNFQPVVIDDFCVIRADFHDERPGTKHDIIITPKMSFGTGHHATTYMMVQAIARHNLVNKSVFDFGTGTGILSILAEKSGASAITAIDIDEWSIENAKENFIKNKCFNIFLFKENNILTNQAYDIILANINRTVILENLAGIKQHLSPGGVLILSGLLNNDQSIIVGEAKKNNLKLNNRAEKDGWICLELINT